MRVLLLCEGQMPSEKRNEEGTCSRRCWIHDETVCLEDSKTNNPGDAGHPVVVPVPSASSGAGGGQARGIIGPAGQTK